MLSLYQKIKAVCKMRAISISSLEQQAGLGENTIFTWDKIVPSADKVLRVAQCLKVSTDSLLGNPTSADDRTLADLEPSTLQIVNELERSKLSADSADVLVDVIRSLKKHIG